MLTRKKSELGDCARSKAFEAAKPGTTTLVVDMGSPVVGEQQIHIWQDTRRQRDALRELLDESDHGRILSGDGGIGKCERRADRCAARISSNHRDFLVTS